jgi:hypothetical protein
VPARRDGRRALYWRRQTRTGATFSFLTLRPYAQARKEVYGALATQGRAPRYAHPMPGHLGVLVLGSILLHVSSNGLLRDLHDMKGEGRKGRGVSLGGDSLALGTGGGVRVYLLSFHFTFFLESSASAFGVSYHPFYSLFQ